MKKLIVLIPLCLAALFIIQGCNTKDQSKDNAFAENKAIEQQINLIQKSIEDIVISKSNGETIKVDTAAKLVRLDSLPVKTRDFETTKYRLKIIEESLNNLNKGLSNNSFSSANCHWEIVGWYSCNCSGSGTTVHCDLCPIKKWVCN
jgi:hypothetical protein